MLNAPDCHYYIYGDAKMYELIFLAVKELAPTFQIIVTDHADLRSSSDFQTSVIERWRGAGVGLVPKDW